MTETRYCGPCEMRHAADAPHCTTCGLLLAAPAAVVAGQHPACAEMVARERRINRTEVGCTECGSLTVDDDDQGRCPACAIRVIESEQAAAFRRIEAAGRPNRDQSAALSAGSPNAAAASRGDGLAAEVSRLEAEVREQEERIAARAETTTGD